MTSADKDLLAQVCFDSAASLDMIDTLKELWRKDGASSMEWEKWALASFQEFIDFTKEYTGDLSDAANEWADSQVHIYNADLWEYAPIFQQWTEEAIAELEMPDSLIKAFQYGEYKFYNDLANVCVSELEKIDKA